MKSRLALALCLLHLSFPSLADKPFAPDAVAGTTLVTAEQAVELLITQPYMVIIDSRHVEEFKKGHIEGAINLLDTDTTSESLKKHLSSKATAVLFYCNGERCLRSSNSAKTAVNLGYKNIYWFRGGWNEWTEKKMPVTAK